MGIDPKTSRYFCQSFFIRSLSLKSEKLKAQN